MLRAYSVKNVKFGKTRTSKLLPFMRILRNDFKIIVVVCRHVQCCH